MYIFSIIKIVELGNADVLVMGANIFYDEKMDGSPSKS
ncbi:hypothetical protein Cyrtocomes_00377 [Candidatus Cyrtobacter comes]|uniref:Uncharacterized protein n=1 Tax=Candidatus Cyrtobacter comes TaxID=675776 RepID=A0ABU5L7A8_9RICK|nr:hypothetical protein [Candidatus Cyrtobacter comes]